MTSILVLIIRATMPRKPHHQAPSAKVREEAVRKYRVRETMSIATLRGTVVQAADFKANCLALMDEVQEKGTEFVITKHNKPVARLVPMLEATERPFNGRGDGFFTLTGNIVSPTAPDWEEGADL